jgi:hypothetical protein
MSIRKIKLDLDELKDLDLIFREICDLGLLICIPILTYLKDEILERDSVNHSLLSQYVLLFQTQLGILGKIWENPSFGIPTIKIENCILTIYNNGDIFDTKILLEKTSFDRIGPRGLVQVLDNITHRILRHYDELLSSDHDTEVYMECWEQIDTAMCSIKSIFSELHSNEGIFKNTYILDYITMDLEIKYDLPNRERDLCFCSSKTLPCLEY